MDDKTEKKKSGRDGAARKQSHQGWSIMRVPTKRALRIYPTGFAKKNLANFPQVMWWPILDDWDGAKSLVEAIMDDDRDALHEFTLQYPEHEFGFESMLKGHDRGGEIVERRTLRSIPLKRGHRLDIDVVTLLNERNEIHARIMRGAKEVAREVLCDDSDEEDEAEAIGTNPANFTMSMPE